jgi:hypothetical protein
MLFGVLRQPIEMAFADELSRKQFHARAQEACDLIERLESELAADRLAEEKAREALEKAERAAVDQRVRAGLAAIREALALLKEAPCSK